MERVAVMWRKIILVDKLYVLVRIVCSSVKLVHFSGELVQM